MTTGSYRTLVMMAIGIRVLKARLSEYVRLARGGETILVTDRDEVVAELRPARRRTPPPGTLEDTLDAMAEAGEVTRASLAKRGFSWKPRGLGLPPGTAGSLLDDARADRL